MKRKCNQKKEIEEEKKRRKYKNSTRIEKKESI